MKRNLVFLLCLLCANSLWAQFTFELLPFGSKLYWKGDSGVAATSTFTVTGNAAYASFINRNDTSSLGDYWSGYAYSKLKDSTSLSYATNDCAAIAAIGHNNSDAYGVAYYSTFQPELNGIKMVGSELISAYITNTTIAYRSMQNGDGFAKKFGGLGGNDPDYFRIIFKGWNNGVLLPDTVQFYLADFRDSNNANDYIVHDWRKVNFYPKLKDADSLSYTLESSDTSQFGINTPAYFCLDDLYITAFTSASEWNLLAGVTLYPNPFIDHFFLKNDHDRAVHVDVFSFTGAQVGISDIPSQQVANVNMKQLPKGLYVVRVSDGTSSRTFTITN